MQSLKGRTALVTGSGRNIGKSIALMYASEGANVIINNKANIEELNTTAKEIKDLGVEVLAIQADISNEQEVNSMIGSGLEKFGTIDILVNNAALRPGTPFVDMEYSDWKKVTGIDLDGAFLCSKLCVPGMISNSWGRIINIAGLMALEGHEGYTHVSASKMGLVGFTRSLAKELAPHNILVNCVSPGTIDTTGPRHAKMTKEELDELAARRYARVPLGRLATVEEISSVCLFLASDGAGYMTGQTMHVNGAADCR
ncbi:MAG: SDR family NAD(P)-dependent oxidoreductase [Dehalococcoidia bacterium]